jgi:prolyl 4-hydroxylase
MSSVSDRSAAVARAHELDAQGRHDDAINELAAAAQREDADATTQLAKRIIIGDRAPRLREQGIGLLRDAVSLGSAEAAARLAVITAAGIGGAPDWQAALRLLVLAADRGWADAQEQLLVLASVLRPDATAATSRAIVESADLRRLLAPPAAGTLIHDDPRIGVLPNFLNERVCARLIERSHGKLERARVYDAFTHTDFVDESRTNSSAMFSLTEADMVHMLVQSRMSLAVGLPVSHMEAPTVLHYAVGETIGNHFDFVDPAHAGYEEEIRQFGNRSITFLVYLNVGGYTSGETVFPHLGVSHSGHLGEGLFFVNTHDDGTPNLRTLHNGRAPTSGEKWIVSQFIRDRPWS